MSIKPVVLANKIRPDKVVEALQSLKSPNKLPNSAIENAVLSVNGQVGHIQIGQTETVSQVNADWNATSGPAQILNKPEIPEVSYPVESVNGQSGEVELSMEDIGGLADEMSKKMDLGSMISVSQIEGMPEIPEPQVQSDWLATSGMANILNKPKLFSGNFSDLKDTPDFSQIAMTGSYSDLEDKPTLFSGAYADLTGKPELFSGLYSDLKDKPALFDGNYNSLTNRPSLFDGTWNSLTGKPDLASVATSGNYVDLKNKPSLFSGSYLDLTNKPTIPSVDYPVKSVNGKTGSVILSPTDIGAAATAHNHTISEITGLQTSLDGKISTGASIPYSSITGKPSIPSNTSQITESSNLYYTDARVQAYLASANYRKVETLQGTTNTSGVYQVTFANTYTTPPHVNPFIVNATPAMVVTVSNITNTGCTVSVQQRNSVTLLGIEVLLAATVPVPSVAVSVLVVSKA